MSESALSCAGLAKSFGKGELCVEVLRGIDLEVARGESVAVLGTSGSGKSTLLHLLAGLDVPDAGTVEIAGQSTVGLSDAHLTRLRSRHLGFVYQHHHLLTQFSAQENVAMPLRLGGMDAAPAMEEAATWLKRVGMGHRLSHRPAQLSGGERQRAAVCRALAARPALVLADEPTGNLDRAAADEVFGVLRELNEETGTALVLVTHDADLARALASGYRLWDGILKREW